MVRRARRPALRRTAGVALALAAAYAALVTWGALAMVSPPRTRVSESARPALGLVMRDVPGVGVVASATVPPASLSGLREGDRLVSVDGEAVARGVDVLRILEGAVDGESFRVEATRDGPDGETVVVLADVAVEVRPVTPADLGLPYEETAFTDHDGRMLRGWYVPPPAGAAPAPGVVHAHGNAADRRHGLGSARALHRAGFAQVLFDFAGRGESDGERITLGPHEADGVRAALDVLAGRPGVDGRRLAIVGRSMGAVAAILAADGDARVRALVLDSPFAALADVVDDALRARGIPPAAVRGPLLAVAARLARFEPRTVRPVDVVGRLAIPILLVHGDRDTVVPLEHARRIAAAAGPGLTFEILPGKDHNDPRPDGFDADVAAFLARATR